MWPGHVFMRFTLKPQCILRKGECFSPCVGAIAVYFSSQGSPFFTCSGSVCVCGDVKSPRVLFRQRRGWAAPHLSNHSVYSPYVSYSHWAAARCLHWIRVRSQLACCRLGGPQACAAIYGGGGIFRLLLFLITLAGVKWVFFANFSQCFSN